MNIWYKLGLIQTKIIEKYLSYFGTNEFGVYVSKSPKFILTESKEYISIDNRTERISMKKS